MVSVNCSTVQLLVIDLRSNTTAIENLDIFGHHLIDTILLLYAEPSLLQQLYYSHLSIIRPGVIIYNESEIDYVQYL